FILNLPSHHSITSSAMASSPGGKLRPNALAVLRLITSSNLVDCMTGRSAGFSPLRIRPVYTPAWRSCDVACHLTLRLGVIHAMGDDTTLSPLHCGTSVPSMSALGHSRQTETIPTTRHVRFAPKADILLLSCGVFGGSLCASSGQSSSTTS